MTSTDLPSVEVLVATMNCPDSAALLRSMHLSQNVTVVNQVTNGQLAPADINDAASGIQFRSFPERGLSRSRNRALALSSADICVIADDDMEYVADYEQIIQKAYADNPEADIIAFYVDSEDPADYKPPRKAGRIHLLTSMKLRSVQITFRRQSIQGQEIRFDESFGSGADNYMGEENIFLAACLRAGLQIYSVPVTIATLHKSESTWFTGYDQRYFDVKGRVFYAMSHRLYLPFILQFAVRKWPLYRRTVSLRQALASMLAGARSQKARHAK